MRPCDWNVLINAETNQYWTDWDCFPKAWLLIVYWLFLSDQMFFCKLSWSVLIVSKFRVNVLLRASARLFTVQLVLKSDAQRRTGSYLQSNWRAAEPWRLHLQPAPQTSRTFRSRIFPQNASVSGSSCSRAAGCHSFVWPPVEPRVRLRAVTQFGDILRDRLFLRPLAACLFSCLSVCLSVAQKFWGNINTKSSKNPSSSSFSSTAATSSSSLFEHFFFLPSQSALKNKPTRKNWL